MESPYRAAAPPAPEPPDPVDAYERSLSARARRARQLKRVFAGVTLLGLGASFVALPLSRASARAQAAERHAAIELELARHERAIRDTIARARADADREQRDFELNVLFAIDDPTSASVERVADAEPCDALPVLRPSLGTARPGALSLLVARAGDRELPSPSIAKRFLDIERAEARLAEGRLVEASAYARLLDAPRFSTEAREARRSRRLGPDVVVVATTLEHPMRTGPTSFDPGKIVGRAFVYDFGARRVVCRGEVEVTSPPTLAYAYVPGPTAPASQDQGPSLSASLEDDLQDQLTDAIRRNLVRTPDDRTVSGRTPPPLP